MILNWFLLKAEQSDKYTVDILSKIPLKIGKLLIIDVVFSEIQFGNTVTYLESSSQICYV